METVAPNKVYPSVLSAWLITAIAIFVIRNIIGREFVNLRLNPSNPGPSIPGETQQAKQKSHTLEKVEPTEQAGNQLYFDTIVVNHISQTKTKALVSMQIDSLNSLESCHVKLTQVLKEIYSPLMPTGSCILTPPLDKDGQPQDLKPSTSKITVFGGHVIKQYGTCFV